MDRFGAWPPGARMGVAVLLSLALWGLIGLGAGALLFDAD